MRRSHRGIRVASFIAFSAAAAACGKSVDVGPSAGPSRLTQTDPGPTQVSSPACSDSDRLHWRFTQPESTPPGALDLLVVFDTSASLKPKRPAIAHALAAFASALAPGANIHMGVLPAHGPSSPYSGRLFASPGNPRVLDASSQGSTATSSQLQSSLLHVPDDPDLANGEYLLGSVQDALKPEHLAESRSLGFFRPGSALSVIFITDENDVCWRPEQHGYSTFPDYVPAPDDTEIRAWHQDCVNSFNRPWVTPEATIAALESIVGSAKLSLAGITHLDPLRVPRGPGIEDSIGHGILELLALTPDSISLEIADPSYTAGLQPLTQVIRSQLTLQTEFTLSGSSAIDASSVHVRVDDRDVAASIDPANRTVRIGARDAGRARSIVHVDACPVG